MNSIILRQALRQAQCTSQGPYKVSEFAEPRSRMMAIVTIFRV